MMSSQSPSQVPAGSTAPDASVKVSTSKVYQAESKLNLILTKKYRAWKVTTSSRNRNSKNTSPPQLNIPGFSHSSPKRLYSSSKKGTSKSKHTRQHSKQVRVEESSDEEFYDLSSPQGSSTQISHFSDTFASQPSLHLLK